MDSKTIKRMPTTLQAWAIAIRPRTLPIAFIQVATGTALAYVASGVINWVLAIYTLFIAVFITIGTNLINDVYDVERGGDPIKRVGFQKVIRTGLLSKKDVYTGGILAFGLAVLFSIPLSLSGGWFMLPIVVLSVICGYCYTGGSYPICYLGLSELFILVFYGFVCVISAFYIQTGFVDVAAFLAAAQMGMLAILPNALNNFRDMFEDAEVNKLTLAVRFGRYFAKREIATLTFFPFVLNLLWLKVGYSAAAFLPLFLIPLAFLFVRSVWITEPGPIFNRYFRLSVLVHFLFGFMLIIGWFLG